MIMKRIQWIFVVAALFLLVVAGKKQPVTFFMVGDSTMANKDVSEGKPERGWGMMFANCFTEEGHVIDRKLIVALTRARHQMIMTGNVNTLSTHPTFRDMLDYIQKQGGMLSL